MNGLSTKDVKEATGGGMGKTIQPGAHVLKVNSIALQQFPFMEKDNAYHLTMEVETKPVEGFEGFFKDTKDESLGRYEGQIGQLKADKWYFKDATLKGGTEISRDMEILKRLKGLARTCGNPEWFEKADGKYPTIEEFVEAFAKADLFKDKWFNVCVAGKEYEKPGSDFKGYDMFLPKVKNKKVGMELVGTEPSMLQEFNENDHFEKMATAAPVSEFGGDAGTDTPASGAPEFAL